MDEKKERFEAYITIIDQVIDSLDDLVDEEASQNNRKKIGIELLSILWILKLAFTCEIEELKEPKEPSSDRL